MPVVSIAHTNDLSNEGVKKATFDAIERSGFKLPDQLKTVILKLNLRYYWDFSTGETTDPRVVSAIIDYIRNHYNHKVEIIIAEADASAMRTKYAFRMLGYEELANKKAVRLINLSECKKVEKKVIVKDNKFNLQIAQSMLDCDLLINVPKLRTHRLTTISCGMKNLFGAITKPRKIVYHSNLDKAIVGMNKLVRCHLTIVDGIISLGKYPLNLGTILVSEDQLAADFVAARIMGYNPWKIRHLKLAHEEGVGSGEEIHIEGIRDMEKLKSFPKENYMLFNLSWRIQLLLLNSYLKMTGDTRPPVLDM
ncbi:MAG: DUF362 domain-containing protein [Candidatus Bathyarchaeota archaeon]|nr:DUF362 domain-containing protein [Candidatus Bathyarchaeota archaeon]